MFKWLKAYVIVKGRVNESIERRNLRRRTQHPGETFDDFLVSLRELAKTCNFCSNDCLQKAIRDQIIEGLCDGESIQELLQVQDLTLDAAISKCRGLEAAKKSRADITGAQEINAASVGKTQDPITQLCMGCGGRQHEGGRKHCPAQQRTCHKCGKTGHFGRVCRQAKKRDLKPTDIWPPTAALTVVKPFVKACTHNPRYGHLPQRPGWI